MGNHSKDGNNILKNTSWSPLLHFEIDEFKAVCGVLPQDKIHSWTSAISDSIASYKKTEKKAIAI